MDVNTRLKQLLQIFTIPLEENWEPWAQADEYTLYHYWKVLGLLSAEQYRAVFEERQLCNNVVLGRYFASLDDHFRPSYYHDGLVADIGSGFGFITFWLILSGAKRVYSIGDPDRIGFIEQLYQRTIEKGLLPEGRIVFKPSFVKVGDTELGAGIAPNSLDLILLNDTLEHITARIFPSLVKATHHGLKPGGRFIARQQNTDSPKMLRRLQAVWEQSEAHEYIPQRLGLIQQYLPDIREADAQNLALKTRGLDSVDFYAALDQFNTNGTYPSHDLNVAPIDVIIDVPHEGDTGIPRIFERFQAEGFSSVKVYPDWNSSRKTAPFQWVARTFPQLFMHWHWGDQTSVFVMRK